MIENSYEVVWPCGKKIADTATFAKRLDTLEGKTIGYLWDWIFRGDEIYPIIEDELSKRYAGIRSIGYETFGSIHGGGEDKMFAALPAKLEQNRCDAVISGMGC